MRSLVTGIIQVANPSIESDFPYRNHVHHRPASTKNVLGRWNQLTTLRFVNSPPHPQGATVIFHQFTGFPPHLIVSNYRSSPWLLVWPEHPRSKIKPTHSNPN